MHKRGLPRQLEEEEEAREQAAKHPIDDFLRGMFGPDGTAVDQDGLPSLEWLKSQYKTKSAAIRYLVNQGYPIKVISKHLGIKYQHARNVATQQLKRGPNEDWRPKPTATPTTEDGDGD